MVRVFVIILSIVFLQIFSLTAFAQTKGEDMYNEGRFQEAEEFFRKKDMDNPEEVKWRYNRACAAFKNNDLESSQSAFSSVLKRTKDKELRFRANYNLGNIAFAKGDFASAAQYFKEALKMNPKDKDARKNLAFSLIREKEAQEQEKKEEKEEDKSKGQDDSDKKEDQDDSENQKSDENNKIKNKGQDTENQNKEQENQEDSAKNNDNQEVQKENTQAGKEEKPPEDQDLSGDLKASQPLNPLKKLENKENMPLPENGMEQRKAEALLENIQENRSVLMKHLQSKEKQKATSGKHW
ncbi:von Willebrand factor type A domain protein [Candidatus Magnetomoraceae bacterium gMMP-15]